MLQLETLNGWIRIEAEIETLNLGSDSDDSDSTDNDTTKVRDKGAYSLQLAPKKILSKTFL